MICLIFGSSFVLIKVRLLDELSLQTWFMTPVNETGSQCGTQLLSVRSSCELASLCKWHHYIESLQFLSCLFQVIGTIIATVVHLGTAWWLINTITNICDRELLPAGSPWICPGNHVFYDASVIFDLIGPGKYLEISDTTQPSAGFSWQVQ